MINSETKLCAVVGNPVSHSLSPLIHNTGFTALKLNFAYHAFCVDDVSYAIDAMRKLNFRGYSVTIPHKIDVMKYVDLLDPAVVRVGAANTVINNEGVLTAYNTDVDGAIIPLKERIKLKEKRVYVLGAGGAARAVVHGLTEEKANVTVYNRTLLHAHSVANQFNCVGKGLNEFDLNYDVLINTTPVGMFPNMNEMPIKKEFLNKKAIIFDVVYTPLETLLINTAKKIGCETIPGVEMFLAQAFAQFELFTGKKAQRKIMADVVLKQLKKREL